MLKLLKASQESEKLELEGGAAVYVRRATAIDYHAAMGEAARLADAIRKGEEALHDAGLEASIASEGDLSLGLAEYLFGVEIAVRCIVSWEGIGDENGDTVEPDRTTIMALLSDPLISRAVHNTALRGLHKVATEGKGCATSPNGGGKVAENTAPDAVH